MEDVENFDFDPRSADERAGDADIKERYKDAIVIDYLIPGSPQSYVDPSIKGFEEMADMSIGGGFTMVSYSVAVDEVIDPGQIVAWIAKGRKHWLANSDKYLMIESVDDIYRAKKEGKLGVNFNFQGSNPLGRNLDMVEIYYKLGVRQINFSYNVPNFMSSGGSTPPEKDAGLSGMGKNLVREMNRVGMIVDCTHSSYNDCLDAAEVSTKPIVLSHSNPRGMYDIQRNAPDNVIKAVAATGGIIATNGLGVFLNEDGEATPERIAEHVNYVKELVGAEHTGFGSDYVHDMKSAAVLILSNPEAFPPEMGYTTLAQMALPHDIWGVARVLEDKYKWTEKEIRGFLGENALRVFKANWQPSE
jgi:microsomal dipeptidase-like Zn-dependent dipeptidase